MIKGDNFLFVENPKCASTSVGRWMRQHDIGKRLKNGPRHGILQRKPRDENTVVIGIVRSPMDRLVSAWRHGNDIGGQPFNRWIEGEYHFETAHDFLRTPQGTWLRFCDEVLHFEKLVDQWPILCQRMGWPVEPLFHANKTEEKKHRPVPTIHGRTLRVIEDRFRQDYYDYGYRTPTEWESDKALKEFD